jgi:probable HAF family extracellular repeat protein
MKRFRYHLVALSLLLAVARGASADYTFTTIDVPSPTGTTGNVAAGINASGQIVGSYTDASSHTHGFLLSQGNYTTLNVPGSDATCAMGINDTGQIVGSYGAGGANHAFLLSSGNYTTLAPPGSRSLQASGINASGEIVGLVDPDDSFLLSGGTYSKLQVPGTDSTQAFGINDSREIVGAYVAGGTDHAFLLSGGNFLKFDAPGSTFTMAAGINNSNQIVGSYFDGNRYHGFLLNNGAYTMIDVPGSTYTYANGINNAGQIVGTFFDTNGNTHGYLATPVTPVSTFAWHGPSHIYTGVIGNPSLIQATPGSYGTKGNYELVVPLQSGGLAHFYRDNDDPNLRWNGPFTFATHQGAIQAVSLIQSNFSSAGNGPGNLAVVARVGNELAYYYRDDVHFAWQGPSLITTGVMGVPSFVQARPGTFGTKGNYELIVPLENGGLAHFYRNNDDPNLPWIHTADFATSLGIVDAASLIQSNFSTKFNQKGVQGPGNLAVVARAGGTLYYFYRDDVAPFAWHGPTMTIAAGLTGNPSLVQAHAGSYGSKGTS